MSADAAIESPCIRECVVDAGTGYCRGCGRTLDEISFWTTYTPDERRRIMAELAGRRIPPKHAATS
jgi:uncharacterized protein